MTEPKRAELQYFVPVENITREELMEMYPPNRAEPANEHAYAESLKKVAETLKDYAFHKEVDICLGAASAMNRMAAEIERLAALERDALRYRFLRSQHWTDGGLVVSNTQWLGVGAIALSRELLDEVIDRQIEAGPESKPDQETKGER